MLARSPSRPRAQASSPHHPVAWALVLGSVVAVVSFLFRRADAGRCYDAAVAEMRKRIDALARDA
jgi:hypothetical protein